MHISARIASISSSLLAFSLVTAPVSTAIFAFVSGTLSGALLLGCSDDAYDAPHTSVEDAGSSTPADGGGGDGGDSDGGGGGSGDGGATAALNGCRSFTDRTAPGADRTVPWNFSLYERDERCMKIRAGQSVTFVLDANDASPADFGTHPVATQGGDSPNPIATALDPQTGEVTFDAPGTFGYVCDYHGAMSGVVLVVE